MTTVSEIAIFRGVSSGSHTQCLWNCGIAELLNARNIPIWVMETVRGGRLCRLDEKDEAVLKQLRSDESIPAWGFRFLRTIPGVQMVLSGMSDMIQMEDNVKTFAAQKTLRDCETSALLSMGGHLPSAGRSGETSTGRALSHSSTSEKGTVACR